MDELCPNLQTEETPAAEAPREVVLRYEAPAPREVTLRYVPPATDGKTWDAPAENETPHADAIPYQYAQDAAPARDGGRRGLWIFLICIGVLLAALVALGILYWRGVLPRRAANASDAQYRYEYGRRGSISEYADAETTIPRHPNGDGTRLRYAESHGSALSIQEIYARVNPCTVTVATALPGGGAIIGAGVIFTPDGYILTNAHVVSGGERCYVVLNTGKSFADARLVGYDVQKDLAVIKVDAYMLPTAEFGDSDALSVGDPVYAIGNPLGVELRGTLTDGIVSAINRDVKVDGVYMSLIQTNAALNSGNSGGPLINVYGQVVGINTMKMGSSSAVSVEGLGFAIPISSAAWMVDELIAYGEIRGEPILGISVLRQYVTLPTGETALQILEIAPGSGAEEAGLRLNDCIVRADGEPMESVSDLLRARRRYFTGEALSMEIDRNGERMTVDVVLKEAQS